MRRRRNRTVSKNIVGDREIDSTMASLTILAVMVAVVVSASFADQAAAQADCTSSLAPCLPYLNATGKAPPAACCTPLKSAVATQKACICNLFNTPGLLQSFGVNSTQVVDLAESCGVNADPTTLCSTGA